MEQETEIYGQSCQLFLYSLHYITLKWIDLTSTSENYHLLSETFLRHLGLWFLEYWSGHHQDNHVINQAVITITNFAPERNIILYSLCIECYRVIF